MVFYDLMTSMSPDSRMIFYYFRIFVRRIFENRNSIKKYHHQPVTKIPHNLVQLFRQSGIQGSKHRGLCYYYT